MSNGNIPDLSNVSQQRSFIESRPEKPSPTSTLYIRRFSTKGGDGRESHTVMGVHVVLAKGNPNGLWEALAVDRAVQKVDADNPKVATGSLVICCDTLEIHGEFSLPEGNVDVFARHLVWADDAASINTSPLAWTTDKARNASGSTPGKNGADGRNAGSLRIFVHQVSPSQDSRDRLIARGGQGQHPGAGQDGTEGDRMEPIHHYHFEITDTGFVVSSKDLTFNPPAVYIKYEWRFAESPLSGPFYLGEDRWPTDGTDALAPGVPGNGGDGGSVSVSAHLWQLLSGVRNKGGDPGFPERNYLGGAAGSPVESAKYNVRVWEALFGTRDAKCEVGVLEKHVSKVGASKNSVVAPRGYGRQPTPVLVREPNAWLHPFGIQAVLEYGRDLFLAGARDEVLALLGAYATCLNQPQPSTEAWTGAPASEWTGAQVEVATMVQRLRAHLDYFGHPAGYTPLLSLAGSIKLYENETKLALRMMLLTGWVLAADREAREATGIMAEAITAANEDSRMAADQVATGEKKIAEVRGLIDALRRQLNGLQNDLVKLRNNLLAKVTQDLQKQAAIKFAIKMAGAICQVIPVGQPALGTIGSLGAVAADFVGGDPDAAPDTISKMGQVLKDANDAADEAEAASKEVKKEKDAPAAKGTKEAEEKSSTWAKIGNGLGPAAKGLGPALSHVADAVKALQVPKTEVEAALARLESEDPEWNRLTRDIRDLNEQKAALFSDLADAIQSVGEGFSRMSSNASTIVRLQRQRDKTLGKLDPEAVFAVRQLGQRSRLTLQKYLYLMVKSYESTLLRPPSVDWNLTNVTEKISALLKPAGGFDAASLNAHADALDVLFQQNLSAIRNKLLTEFDFREDTSTLKLGLTLRQTPHVLNTLNDKGRIVINPEDYGLILPDRQLARLSNVKISKFVFDPAGPSLPDNTNAVASLVPATTGTIRRDEGLYVLGSDAPVRWQWTYISAADIRAATPSATAQDVLDFILGTGAENIKQKVSLPPAWSDLRISVLFSPPLPEDRRPRIAELYFEVQINSSPAPDFQRVLSVQPMGTPAGVVTSCSADLAQRSNGTDRMIRIFNKGDMVDLSVPAQAGGSIFERWNVIGTRVDETALRSTSLRLKLDDHVLAESHWARSGKAAGPVVDLALHVDAATLARAVSEAPTEELRAALTARFRRPQATPAVTRPIRVEPQDTATVIGILPPQAVPDVLQKENTGWQLVNYQGVVGWVGGGTLLALPQL
jgi:hypothetical protein